MKANLKKAIVLATTLLCVTMTAAPAMASTMNTTAAQTKVMAATKTVAVKSIALNRTQLTLNPGSSSTLTVKYNPTNTTVKAVTWKSSNAAVASVSGGKITAKMTGTATITATVGGKSATCKVTVKVSQPTGSKFVSTTECYNKLNEYRKAAKLSSLKKDATLESLAKVRATELIKKFSHTRPNGNRGLSIIPGNLRKGENIAKGQKSCSSVMSAWYKSTGHKDNMLHKGFTKVGIAGIEYQGTMYWVQLFSN